MQPYNVVVLSSILSVMAIMATNIQEVPKLLTCQKMNQVVFACKHDQGHRDIGNDGPIHLPHQLEQD